MGTPWARDEGRDHGSRRQERSQEVFRPFRDGEKGGSEFSTSTPASGQFCCHAGFGLLEGRRAGADRGVPLWWYCRRRIRGAASAIREVIGRRIVWASVLGDGTLGVDGSPAGDVVDVAPKGARGASCRAGVRAVFACPLPASQVGVLRP